MVTGTAAAGYRYEDHRAQLFTEDGQRIFLAVRDRAQELIDTAGAFDLGRVMAAGVKASGGVADTFELIACVDRLVELGELREVVKGSGVYVGTRR